MAPRQVAQVRQFPALGVARAHRRRPTEPSGVVIDAASFRGFAARERDRAERFNESLLLVSVSVKNGAPEATWEQISDALATAVRRSDVVGWLESRSVLGVLLPDIGSLNGALVHRIESRVRSCLTRTLGFPASDRIAIALHAHPSPSAARAEALVPLEQDLERGISLSRDGVKRVMDVGMSLALLLVFSPVLLLIALLVKFSSPGPVLFKQVRVGQMAKPFTMLKFRTMRADSEPTLHRHYVTRFIKVGGDELRSGEDGLFKLTMDPRVTRIGALLRRTSLDELPQFWNVLRGDMSLVGPRPPLDYEYAAYKPWHRRRVLDAKPGVTGLWQVVGRSRTTFDEMVRMDLQYARSRSLWLDLKLLLATPRAVISGKGAA